MRKVLVGVVLTLLSALLLVPVAQKSPVDANPGDESAFVAAVNRARANAGLPALVVDGQLTSLARGWAQHQASAGQISHANPISSGVTSTWSKLGENVGTGPSVQPIMDAFIASPGHRANILDPEFTHIGVGVVWSGPAMYTTHRFMALASPPPTTVAPPPTTAAPVVTTPPAPTAPPATAPPATTPPPAPTAPPATSPPAPTTAPPTTTTAPPPPETSLPPATPERVAVVLTALRAAAS